MIDFRYHVVSIVAVFLALATGLVLGASLLNSDLIKVLQNRTSTLADDKDELRAQLDAANGQTDFLQQMTADLGPLAVRDELLDETVVVLALPGADKAAVSAVTTLASQSAGAQITGVITVTDQWTAPDQASVLDSLVAQLVPDGVTLPAGTAYDRAAALLSAALVTDPTDGTSDGSTTPPPEESGGTATNPPGQHAVEAILAGLQAGGFISYDTAPPLADLAIVVAGPPPETSDPDQISTANGAWVSLAATLDDVGAAAVLAGPSGTNGTNGAIAALLADPTAAAAVSTVGSVDAPSGQVATVLALSAEVSGVTGHYGPSAADGPIPDLSGG